MRRAIGLWSEWWIRLFVLSVVVAVVLGTPWWVEFPLWAGLLILAFTRAPWDRDQEPRWVAPPVRGRWVPVNSPGTKVPSHGVRVYGQTYAIDILHPRPAGTPPALGWGAGMRQAGDFETFGDAVHSVADGTVVASWDGARDHRSRESWPAIVYLMVVEAFVRQVAGGRFVLGNHVIVDHGDGVFATYAHLRRGSVRVKRSDRVTAGQQIGDVGNSGNASEPHLHFQLTDDPRLPGAAGVPFRWNGISVPLGDVDPSWSKKPVSTDLIAGLPADGQVFEVPAALPVHAPDDAAEGGQPRR